MDNHDERIQASQPLPPWRLPGYVRRDCEPHRGSFLTFLSVLSMCLGGPGLLMPLLLPVALSLAGTTCYLASSDLRKMKKGEKDPQGEHQTETALQLSQMGLFLSALGVTFWALLLVNCL
jgi:hypothetical protein